MLNDSRARSGVLILSHTDGTGDSGSASVMDRWALMVT